MAEPAVAEPAVAEPAVAGGRRTVLVTGFEPFGGDPENASQAAVEALAARWTGPARLVTAVLPVSFASSTLALRGLLAEHRPDLVVAVGEAGRRRAVSIETRARNLDDARIADNEGDQPRAVVVDDGPEWLPTRLDVASCVEAVRRTGVLVAASHDAGTFVCNHVFRVLLTATEAPAGLVHVPALRSTGRAGVGAETDASAVAAPASDGSGASEASAEGSAAVDHDELAAALLAVVEVGLARVRAATRPAGAGPRG
ncbi:pyroglutamyl-peptidase I [Auraticoccus monumenti]|uniref:Pyrrolidone-carboxylate peptidase n=1 Tax=Auraticoccus monumenti TaxID=675864 RepID=A0A1G6RMV8_9ACTN|nr:pyroglutamyl-peptidase I [Auraticoccus monumenti]SDD05684.1 pyroglutamyl-peptidase [Auraticoccus monumenti]